MRLLKTQLTSDGEWEQESRMIVRCVTWKQGINLRSKQWVQHRHEFEKCGSETSACSYISRTAYICRAPGRGIIIAYYKVACIPGADEANHGTGKYINF